MLRQHSFVVVVGPSPSLSHAPPLPPTRDRFPRRRRRRPASFIRLLIRRRFRLRRGLTALSDIRQSYLISFYRMRTVFIAFIAYGIAFITFVACDCIKHMRYQICRNGCSTTFIVVDVAGEAVDEAEEEASTVLPRHVVPRRRRRRGRRLQV